MTTPLAPAQAAPRPTVRLQPQQAAGVSTGTISSAPLKPAAAIDDEDEEANEKGLGLLAGIATGLAALFLMVALFSWEGIGSIGVSLDQKNPGWKIPRKSVIKAGEHEDYAQQDGLGAWSTDLKLAEIPQYQAPN
jgi:hypothetical protein